MASSGNNFDYIIVGGGLSGCVVAARLHQTHPSLSIALLEAGPDKSHDPVILSPILYPTLHGTPLQYSYQSTSQPQIEGRSVPNWGGRLRESLLSISQDAFHSEKRLIGFQSLAVVLSIMVLGHAAMLLISINGVKKLETLVGRTLVYFPISRNLSTGMTRRVTLPSMVSPAPYTLHPAVETTPFASP